MRNGFKFLKKTPNEANSSVVSLKKKTILSELKKNYSLLLMIIPGLIALILFNYKPMYGLLIAFKEYKFKDGVLGSAWASQYGMEYVIRMFTSGDFIKVMKNTVSISFMKLLFGIPVPVILALLLNEMRCKSYKRVTQTLTYLPHFFSWVILGGIFKMIFSSTGPLYELLSLFGVSEPMPFLANNTYFYWIIILTSVWQGAGWAAIVYLAALTGIDQSLYEAATIDGANRWKQTLHISIPSIVGTIAIMFILNLGQILNAGFDQIYNMYNVMVYDSSDIIDTYSLRLLQGGNYETGAALGLFKSVVSICFVCAGNWLVNRLSDNEYGIL